MIDNPASARRQLVRRLTVSAAIMFVCHALVACGGGGEDAPEAEAEGAEEEVQRPLVEVATLNTSPFEDHIELTGVTEPVLEANVTPQIGGRVLKVDLEEGARVEADSTVLVTDTSTQSARIGSLRVQVDQIGRDVGRTEKLLERGLATRADLDALKTQRDVLRKQIQEVRAGKRQAVTRAPIGGVVTRRDVEPGEFASGGQPIGRIIDISTIVVHVGLPEAEIRYVSEGQEVDVVIEALGEIVTGRLQRIGLEANANNRTFPLEIHVSNPDSTIRAGMRATVRLLKTRVPDAVVIPRDAVLQSLDGQMVFVIDDELVAQARDVELGPGLVRYVVVENGLEAGEKLVVRGHRALVRGEEIEVVSDAPCCAEQLEDYLSGDDEGDAETADAEPAGDPPDPQSDEQGETDPKAQDDPAEAVSENTESGQ